MKRVLIAALPLLVCHAALAMTGGPFFSVSPQLTAMTVEACQANLELPSARTADGAETAVSQRAMLVARYGLMPGLDFSGKLGAANLSFSDLPNGYSEIDGDWAFAWGASVRLGWPQQPRRFQVLAAVDYLGFQPSTSTSLGEKTIDSRYLWHEIAPVLAVGMRLGSVVPYVGVTRYSLFGRRDVTVAFRGNEFPAASGREAYTDGEQPARGILGLEWRLPDGYSIGAEAATTTGGLWTLSIALAQVMWR